MFPQGGDVGDANNQAYADNSRNNMIISVNMVNPAPEQEHRGNYHKILPNKESIDI